MCVCARVLFVHSLSVITLQVFRCLVNYLVTDDVPELMPIEYALELLMLANAYQVTRLEEICEQVILYIHINIYVYISVYVCIR